MTGDPKMPPNRGRIHVAHNNKSELRFWIRVFELEPQIAEAQAHFKAHQESEGSAWAAVPIINKYVSGDLTWFYVLIIEVDILGVAGGTGIIWYADQENCESAAQSRDKFADQVMVEMQQRTKAGKLTELIIVESGQQQ
jgi:hypothetical protein